MKEELICKFRSVLESHLEQENKSLQQEDEKEHPELESSSMEDSTSFGESDNSLVSQMGKSLYHLHSLHVLTEIAVLHA